MRCMVFLACVWSCASLANAADDSPLGLSYVRTRDLMLVYFDNLAHLEPLAVRTFSNSQVFQRRTFGWVPSEPTTILMKDYADYGNAGASALPRDRIVADIGPTSHAFETSSAAERMLSLMNHEMVHIATFNVTAPEDRFWRSLFFGKVPAIGQNPETMLYNYLSAPRFSTPRWYLEGSAVFMETWMTGGLGRAQGGYDEMVFRAMVRDDAPFFDPLGLESRGVRIDFQVGANAYLYGTRFMTWLAFTHSPDKLVQWLRRDAGSSRSYAASFAHVYGIPLEQAWQEWIAFEKTFQQKNLAQIRQHPITPQTRLTSAPIGSISRAYYDAASATLYAAVRYPGTVEHVAAINTRDGSVRRLTDIKGAMLYRVASFALDAEHGTAFFTNDNNVLRDLMAVDITTGQQRMLLENARIGEIVYNRADRSLLGVQHEAGLATLMRIPYPYTEAIPVLGFPYEAVPSDLDISPDGKLLSATVSDVSSQQFLRVWELDKILAGDARPLSEFKFGQSVPESFVFSADSKYLYGSSYYTGVSNIFRYEVATGAIEAVSNAETGLFRPIPLNDGRLIAMSYTGQGFVPVIIPATVVQDVSATRFLGAELIGKYPQLATWQVPPPSAFDYDRAVTQRGIYRPLQQVGLVNAYPVLQGYKNAAGIGYHANFEDPISFVRAGATFAWTPNRDFGPKERLHIDADASYLGWRAALSWNHADFYDLSGPTKRSRKGFAAKLGHDETLIYDAPRQLDLKTDIAFYNRIDTLPGAQNVGAAFDRLIAAQLGLHYTDLRRSLGAVDQEKGLNWRAVVNLNRTRQTTAQARAGIDFGLALPLAHASLWSYSAAGQAAGNRADPVASFYFGAFGNNRIDKAEIKRYRDHDAMPGFGVDQIKAFNFVKQTVELNLPPLVFESVGVPRLHLAWLRPSVFASLAVTDLDSRAQRSSYRSIGSQADLRFSALHWYELTLSLGYAIGFKDGRRAGSEAMLSLKIM